MLRREEVRPIENSSFRHRSTPNRFLSKVFYPNGHMTDLEPIGRELANNYRR